jgi:hypothetical protein
VPHLAAVRTQKRLVCRRVRQTAEGRRALALSCHTTTHRARYRRFPSPRGGVVFSPSLPVSPRMRVAEKCDVPTVPLHILSDCTVNGVQENKGFGAPPPPQNIDRHRQSQSALQKLHHIFNSPIRLTAPQN